MNVLIIDDEPMNRLVLKRLLSRFSDLTVFEAEDGEAAWEALGDARPALIFCDIYMPRMDGLAFLQRIREHQLFGDLPVIITSAGKDRDLVLKLRDLRITDYLLKPFELENTFRRLETHVSRLRQANKETRSIGLGQEPAAPAGAPGAPEAVAAAVPKS